MALEMGLSAALAAGDHVVMFTDSTLVMDQLVDPMPHSGQASSLVACSALHVWLSVDAARTLSLWHVPSHVEWSIHQDAHELASTTKIPFHLGVRVSLDFVCASMEEDYHKDWHAEFQKPEYRGKQFLGRMGNPLPP